MELVFIFKFYLLLNRFLNNCENTTNNGGIKVVEEMNKRLQQGSISFKPINLTINMGKRDDWQGGHLLQEIPSLLNACPINMYNILPQILLSCDHTHVPLTLFLPHKSCIYSNQMFTLTFIQESIKKNVKKQLLFFIKSCYKNRKTIYCNYHRWEIYIF